MSYPSLQISRVIDGSNIKGALFVGEGKFCWISSIFSPSVQNVIRNERRQARVIQLLTVTLTLPPALTVTLWVCESIHLVLAVMIASGQD